MLFKTRRRAFSWLFSDGECEEVNASQTVESHVFPHLVESKEKTFDSSSALKSLDINRRPRSSTPIVACKRSKTDLKENEDPGMVTNPYQAFVIARDSLRHREEEAKMQAEIQKLDDEVGELKQKTEMCTSSLSSSTLLQSQICDVLSSFEQEENLSSLGSILVNLGRRVN
ncbi:uncharacterized protein LOC107850335 [Capsicum annuum]|uniref:uncharacterized protein LOC107850335 n=1 Tax=Capsicum annuum TaxID=4072 RepID=UPI001FB18F7B|nr:uncharacterized protein LOC107850335 [Capsicum annuum]